MDITGIAKRIAAMYWDPEDRASSEEKDDEKETVEEVSPDAAPADHFSMTDFSKNS